MIRIMLMSFVVMGAVAAFAVSPALADSHDHDHGKAEASQSLVERVMGAITGEKVEPQPEAAPDMPASDKGPLVQAMPTTQVTIESSAGTRYLFNVEMATTESQREKGLMGRTELRQDAGMLFVFPIITEQSFWMKDTLIPLDILFISENGVVNHIHRSAIPQDKSMITSPKPVKAVVEINGGLSDKLGFTEGSVVYHEIFNNMNLLSPAVAQDDTGE